MNILLINHYAGSPAMGMEFRPYYFAREWSRKGHKVHILAADYSHIRRVNPSIDHDFQTEEIDGISYHWIHTGKYNENGLQRAITMGQFIGKLWLHAKKIVREYAPDVVICSSTYPLDTYVGQRIRRLSPKKVKLIHEVHDMWPISPVEIGGMSRKHPFIRIMQCGENSFCRNSDAVVSLLPNARDYFIEHGMEPSKFHHIANGVVPEEWEHYEKLPQELAAHFQKNRGKGKFNLCFFGTIQKTYNLEMLISVVRQMNDPHLALTLIGPGMDKEELQQLAGDTESISFFDPIPKKAVPDLFNYIDAVFIGAKSSRIFRFGICMNKLFDSMMGGKPILYMVDAPNNYIEEYHCGITVHGTDEAALVEGIQKLLSLSASECRQLGENGIRAAVEEFNYPQLAKKFTEVMEN